MFRSRFLPLALFLSSWRLSAAGGYAKCRKACQNVGVQLQSSALPGNIQLKSQASSVQQISQAFEAETKEIQNKHEKQIAEILNSIRDLKREIENTREALCPLSFNGKCYWVVLDKNMNYTKAKEVCARIPNGKPSNIYGHDHLFVVLRYLRTLVRRNQVSVYAWLGMTVDPETEKVSFRDGGTPRSLEWRANKPEYALDYTQLMIMARTDGNRRQEGLYNQNPKYGKPAVLCEV